MRRVGSRKHDGTIFTTPYYDFDGGFLVVALLVDLSGTAARAQTAFDDPSARNAASGAGGGDLVPVDPAIDGGVVSIGATAQIVVLFATIAAGRLIPGPSSFIPPRRCRRRCR